MKAPLQRHAFGESFWWIPMGYALTALAFGMAFPRLEARQATCSRRFTR